MKKSEKLKALAAVAEVFDLTPEEAAAYFGKISAHSEELEDASVQSEKVVSTDVVRPGMYYYSDGTISADVIQGKQISGVVGWVDESGRHGLVFGLRETRLPWSSDCLAVKFPEYADGRENTYLILDAAQKQNKKAEAAEWCAAYAFAEWCAAYAFDGIHAGEAFLPGKAELVKIFKSFNAIQNALEKINQPWLEEDDRYWSSSEDDYGHAWVVRPSNGYMYYHLKSYSTNLVRCVWKF